MGHHYNNLFFCLAGLLKHCPLFLTNNNFFSRTFHLYNDTETWSDLVLIEIFSSENIDDVRRQQYYSSLLKCKWLYAVGLPGVMRVACSAGAL